MALRSTVRQTKVNIGRDGLREHALRQDEGVAAFVDDPE